MKIIVEKERCVGCGSCIQCCPQKCIKMVRDEEGFLYPWIDTEKCIDCGLCKRKCPVLNDAPAREVSCYWAKVEDRELLNNSSSGGAFSWLALWVLQKQGVVFGARYDENMHVYHSYIENISELSLLQKSKYVQSDLRNTYIECRQFLENNREVLFVGTPCQVAGLKSFLNKEYENLLTIDLICSGVGSPLVWEKYVEYLQKKVAKRIVRVDMRDKRESWERFNFSVGYEDGSEYSVCYSKDLYTKAYVKKLINRPVCYQCEFVKDKHLSDFTIGDLWGIEECLHEWDDEGNSVIIVNTNKAKKILEENGNGLLYSEVQTEVVKKYNWPLERSAEPHQNRKKFFTCLNKGKCVVECMDNALRFTIVDRIIMKLKQYM